MTKYQLKMAEYYNKRVKLKGLNIRDLVYARLPLQLEIQPRESLAPYGKDPTESSTTLDREATTWKP